MPGPWVGAFGEPWRGEVPILAGVSSDALSERVRLSRRATIARLMAPVSAGPLGRWDRATRLEVQAPYGEFASLPEDQLLSGGNLAALESDLGWEILQFQTAELVGDRSLGAF